MTQSGIAGYREFLKKRDGKADIYRDTLSAREDFFAKLAAEPVRSRLCFDRELYLRSLGQRRRDAELSDQMLWLLATAEGNQAERFGVELGLLYGHAAPEGSPAEQVNIVLQEFYHTRVLADVVEIFDLPVPRKAPPLAVRWAIYLMVFNPLPERFNLPLVGVSEMLGCVFFRLLRDRGVELFADEPLVAERIRLLFNEILADELCHVGLIEARLGKPGRRLMHWLFRLAAAQAAKSSSPLARVVGAHRVAKAYGEPFDLPARVAEFPETAYCF